MITKIVLAADTGGVLFEGYVLDSTLDDVRDFGKLKCIFNYLTE
jgi:hypothetical protein